MHELSAADGISKRLLTASFAVILILLAVLEIAAYVESRASQQRVEDLVTNALRSVELVGQIGMDVQRERMLTERHILESDPAGWNAVERDLAANRADFHKAAAAYAEHLRMPGELAAWTRLAVDIAVKDELAPAVIALSRANRDTEARRRLDAMQPLFDAIQADVARLVKINRAGAQRARTQMNAVQHHAVEFRIVLGICIGTLLTLLGIALTRALARNERRLNDKTRALEDKNRELDAFAGRVAHDLRGPLSAISVASYLLGERVPQQAKMTGVVQRSVAQMTNLVDELLELSRIGVTANATGRTEPVAAAIAEELAARVRDVGGRLRVALEPAVVRCSEGLLHQILWNVAENALKYRRPEVAPEIEISGRVIHSAYELTISDNGVGMSHDDAAHVFEPFFRARRTSSISGTGLGLSIVRRIIDACGGTVAVSSELGQGTRIVIRLPLADAPAG